MRTAALALFTLAAAAGCGTTRTTDTQRAATEMLLVSAAVDQAVARLDFAPLAGKAVFLDTQYLDKGVVDKGYVVSALRQQLLAHGAMLMDERRQAIYVVEPRSGGVGTDRHTLLVGSPAVSVPALLPGVPTSIPEIALVKKTDQKGVAKLAVFAYNRVNGRAVWQSGPVEETSILKDTWVFGAGPFSRGSIRRRTELAGEELPTLPTIPSWPFSGATPADATAPLTQAAGVQPNPSVWLGDSPNFPPHPVPLGLMGLVGPAAVADRPIIR